MTDSPLPRRPRGNTLMFSRPVSISGFAAVGGKREMRGPFGPAFALTSADDLFGEDSWEKAEVRMQAIASDTALTRARVGREALDFILAGDLLNQCTASAYAARSHTAPFLGLYGACSTIAESLLLGACLLDGGFGRQALCVSSSHFCAAERQYRFPLEYGSIRPPSAQWTVTGAGALLLQAGAPGPGIVAANAGVIQDYNITDMNNMGAAMAPAACETLLSFFRDTSTRPEDYDGIFTGDLGRLGRDILAELLLREGYPAGDRLCDCGTLIYAAEDREVCMGGSGCGCGASVLCAHILPEMCSGGLQNVLFVATGALMSPTSSAQGESIPAIAHLIHLVA
ncbi:MAG: stage V sporulation protein AD [Clostridia bacterium]|nr:stage V sporulation protein AD [Clostridia bacterium]